LIGKYPRNGLIILNTFVYKKKLHGNLFARTDPGWTNAVKMLDVQRSILHRFCVCNNVYMDMRTYDRYAGKALHILSGLEIWSYSNDNF
jgi:hypothetical protein